ncbi:MAG: serine hydrolase, partial [Actinomycetota bacterium]
ETTTPAALPVDPALLIPIPIVDGRPELPESWPIAEPLTWMLDALTTGEIDPDDAATRFNAGFLAAVPIEQITGLVTSLAADNPTLDVVEIVFLTPISARVMLGDPAATQGFLLDLSVEHSTGLVSGAVINPFPYQDGNTAPADASLGVDDLVGRLQETATEVGAVMARIDGGSCTPIEGHDEEVALATGSQFKGWILGALATAVEDGELSLDTPVVVTDSERAPGSVTDDIVAGTELTLLDAAVLMMGNSDNTMTDHLHELVGREAVEAFVAESGHADPDLLTPFVSVNEWDNLIFSISADDAATYLAGANDEQRTFLDQVIVPMGAARQGGFANTDVTLDLSWNASAMDLCRLMARLRQFEAGTEARRLIDQAYGAGGVLAGVRRNWDLTWYKGGGIPTADGAGLDVLTHGWMVEDTTGAYAVVVLSNGGPVDEFASASVAQRLHRLLRDSAS